MPVSPQVSLLLDFQTARNIDHFLLRHFSQIVTIPARREPEFGYVMQDIQTIFALEEDVHSHPNVRIIPGREPHGGILITLPEDTVDEHGYPTRLIETAGLEKRRRFNFVPRTAEIERFDVSFKDAVKSFNRREWEAAATCFKTGNLEATRKVARDLPEVASIDTRSYRVMGTCAVSRATSYFTYILEDESACLLVESNDDICAIATPHADVLLGYRLETEFEIKKIFVPMGKEIDTEETHTLLDRGLFELRSIIEARHYDDQPVYTNVSKAADTTRRVKEYYETQPHTGGMDGLDFALMQNVLAETFLGKAANLTALASTIPSPKTLARANRNTSFDLYFPRNTQIQERTTRLIVA